MKPSLKVNEQATEESSRTVVERAVVLSKEHASRWSTGSEEAASRKDTPAPDRTIREAVTLCRNCHA